MLGRLHYLAWPWYCISCECVERPNTLSFFSICCCCCDCNDLDIFIEKEWNKIDLNLILRIHTLYKTTKYDTTCENNKILPFSWSVFPHLYFLFDFHSQSSLWFRRYKRLPQLPSFTHNPIFPVVCFPHNSNCQWWILYCKYTSVRSNSPAFCLSFVIAARSTLCQYNIIHHTTLQLHSDLPDPLTVCVAGNSHFNTPLNYPSFLFFSLSPRINRSIVPNTFSTSVKRSANIKRYFVN